MTIMFLQCLYVIAHIICNHPVWDQKVSRLIHISDKSHCEAT